ncbi:MAG: hypothetical protein O2960_07765 [Verrucomicrobia bacterium]|nr:hypothetical protein [Verrucomicrobiota bacterium]
MIRNRKKLPVAVRFGLAVKLFLLCLIVCLFGIGYVGQKNQLYFLSSQYKELERDLSRLQRENAIQARKLDSLQSLSELEARINEMNLDLVPPLPHEVVRLADELSEWPETERNHLYVEARLQSDGRVP